MKVARFSTEAELAECASELLQLGESYTVEYLGHKTRLPWRLSTYHRAARKCTHEVKWLDEPGYWDIVGWVEDNISPDGEEDWGHELMAARLVGAITEDELNDMLGELDPSQ